MHLFPGEINVPYWIPATRDGTPLSNPAALPWLQDFPALHLLSGTQWSPMATCVLLTAGGQAIFPPATPKKEEPLRILRLAKFSLMLFSLPGLPRTEPSLHKPNGSSHQPMGWAGNYSCYVRECSFIPPVILPNLSEAGKDKIHAYLLTTTPPRTQ